MMMRRGLIGSLAMLAAAGLAVGAPPVGAAGVGAEPRRKPEPAAPPENVVGPEQRPRFPSTRGAFKTLPHQGDREAARRRAQLARKAAKGAAHG